MDKRKLLREFKKLSGIKLNEDDNAPLFDFTKLPDEIKSTLDEYDNYTNKFDWNEKSDELGPNFREWHKNFYNNQLAKHIDDIIAKTTQDMILIKKRKLVNKKLESFEELIKPVLGDSALTPVLNKFQEEILMDPNLSPSEVEQAFMDSKNIMDSQGNIDQSKIQNSEIFRGGEINVPGFERLVKEKPELQGVYNDWKKLFDEDNNLMFKELHAFRDTLNIDKIRELRGILMDIKNIL